MSKKTCKKPEIIKGTEPLSNNNKIIFLDLEEFKYSLNAHMQKNDGSQLKRLTQFKKLLKPSILLENCSKLDTETVIIRIKLAKKNG